MQAVHKGSDVRVENHGSLFLFRALTTEALQVLLERTDASESQWFGGALVVEPRYAADFAQGLIDDGYIVV